MGQCAKCGRSKECDYVWKDPSEPYMNCVSYTPPPLTNADRIRAMTDEELAAFHVENPNCPPPRTHGTCEELNCFGCWFDWLREEVKDGDSG